MPKYQVHVSRYHLTETRPLRGTSLSIPVVQDELFSFKTEEDVFACSQEQLMAIACSEAGSESVEEAQNWSPWQPRLLREAYEFATPAHLHLDPASPAGAALAEALELYPDLFGTGEFASYRVFAFWFCTTGNGLRWDANGCLTDGQTRQERLAQVARFSDGRAVPSEQDRHDRMMRDWGQSPVLPVPVKLYPISPRYSNIFKLPENVDDSYLAAAGHLLNYLLSRPVWENHAYEPKDLLKTPNDGPLSPEQWREDTWRYALLANGAHYRALVEQAYARLVLGPWRCRLEEYGVKDEGFYPQDYRLPPRARIFYLMNKII